MAAIQCKMCGGMVDVVDGVTSKECPYCGTLTTFPKISDDRRENLYNRAEHFRRAGDFDKAVAAYESILNDDSSDPEAYWGIAISRFGIEYVEDPATRERIPTCHRVQYESFTSDPDYLSALEHSAGTAEHEIYEREGARIAEIQKNILKISAQEKPFDIFICYKESTDGGTRTKDSAIAQDIYYQLTNAGYKVFFARITLESKLGQQYEPYIFAALNSAKVMLVIGSKAEYFNAVWVKNEWSRFLALKKKDNSRLIIPCYRDMDPYDLPEELSLFQSQDMSKIGFIQDILHGIKKVLRKEEEQPKSAEPSGVTAKSNVLENLIRRIVMFIHDGDSKSAAEYCEKVLDQNMECGIVYYYKTLLECEVFSAADLILKDVDFTGSKNFRHALSFSTGEEKEKLDFLARAWKFMGSFKSKSVYDLKTFSANCDKYLDANDAKILNKIIDKRIAEVNALERIYNSGLAELETKNYKSAIEIFKSLPEVYKDSEKQQQFAVDSAAYERALALETEKNYKEARDEFEKILSFSDAKDHFCECQYLRGELLIREKKYVEAKSCFDNLKEYSYKDCNVRSIECQQLYDTQLLLQKVKKIATVAAAFLLVGGIIAAIFGIGNWMEKLQKEEEEKARQEAAEKARQERLAAEEKARLERIAAEKARKEHFENRYNNIMNNMVEVKAGSFKRGSSQYKDTHTVILTKDYWIGKYEVTQSLYTDVMGENPSNFRSYGYGADRPVECVSWNDAKTFCDKLNELYRDKLPAGYRFDLPTEAQWEFAARGGNKSKGYKYSGSNHIDDVAWYSGSDRKSRYLKSTSTSDVGKLKPNELGLYDMSGNVWEWCRDSYYSFSDYSGKTVTDPEGSASSSYYYRSRSDDRIYRGGSWESRDYGYNQGCQILDRNGESSPENRGVWELNKKGSTLGFRLALVPID